MLDFFADIKSGIRSGNVRFQEDLTLPILNQIYVRKKVKKVQYVLAYSLVHNKTMLFVAVHCI